LLVAARAGLLAATAVGVRVGHPVVVRRRAERLVGRLVLEVGRDGHRDLGHLVAETKAE
jgi:hypothetical protein